jgi:dipeptidase D
MLRVYFGGNMEKYNIKKMQNEKFYKFFKDISDIPRSPGNENKIAEYLVNFAMKRNLKYYIDDIYNVIIWKQASIDYENKPVLGLQNHTDMVCQKTEDSNHNFYTDPIELIIDGDYVRANNTTLGADNGVGIAYVLSVLDSDEILSPELECIFTVQEETSMNGSKYIDVSKIKSRRIIS